MEVVVFGPIAPMLVLALAFAHPLVVGVIVAPLLLFGLLGYHGGFGSRPGINPVIAADHARYLRHLENTQPKIGHSLTDARRALAIVAILCVGVVVVLGPLYYFAGYY